MSELPRKKLKGLSHFFRRLFEVVSSETSLRLRLGFKVIYQRHSTQSNAFFLNLGASNGHQWGWLGREQEESHIEDETGAIRSKVP